MIKLNQTLLTLVFILSFSGLATAQKTAIKTNLLNPFLSTASIAVEYGFAPDKSVQLSAFYANTSIFDTNIEGIGITPELRIFISQNDIPMQGIYVAPSLRYQNLKLALEDEAGTAKMQGYGAGLVIGRQWIYKERIVIDGFAGSGYSYNNFDFQNGAKEDDFDLGRFSGLGIRAGLSLGLLF